MIDAPASVIFQLAADVLRWPELLQHYRYVHLLDGPRPDGSRTVRMGAVRSGIPVSWTAVQRPDPPRNLIYFSHISGATTGMEVVWRIEPAGEGLPLVWVVIDHFLAGGHWWMRNPLADLVAGRFFVAHIADLTLRGIKHHAEAFRAAGTR